MVLDHPGQHFTGSQLRALQKALEDEKKFELLGDLLQAMALVEEAVAAFVRYTSQHVTAAHDRFQPRCLAQLLSKNHPETWFLRTVQLPQGGCFRKGCGAGQRSRA